MNSEEDKTSLEGKGWDILAGGKEHAFSVGGDDPFDKEALPFADQPAADIDEGANPFSDEEAEAILRPAAQDSGHGTATPQDAFWDRGRGSSAEPSSAEGGVPELPPRDLRPEDLGYRPQPEREVEYKAGPLVTPPPPARLSLPPRDLSPDDPMFAAEAGEPGEPPQALPAGAATPWEQPEEELPPEPGVAEAQPSPATSFESGASIQPEPEEEQPAEPTRPPVAGAVGVPEVLPLGEEPEEEAEEPEEEAPPHLVAGEPPLPAEPLPEEVPPVEEPAWPSDEPPWELPTQAGVARPFGVYDPFEPVSGEEPIRVDEDLPVDAITYGPMLITPERVNGLWEEINTTYDMVIKGVRGHFRTTEQALADLKKARELLLSGYENFDNAEVLVKKVKARLELEEKVRAWSGGVGRWIALYLIACLAVLILLALLKTIAEQFLSLYMPVDMALAYMPALFGALGGTVGALWVLIEHTARKRDFDPIHTRWYMVNPFMGAALGVVVYAIFRAGVIGLSPLAASEAPLETIEEAPTPWMVYAIALVAGFQQNVVWDLLTRVLDLIKPAGEDEGPSDVTPPSSM
jgi:hypothetical protein